MKDREISEEEKTQAADIFAKIRIYYNEYQSKLAERTRYPRTSRIGSVSRLSSKRPSSLARIYSDTVADNSK